MKRGEGNRGLHVYCERNGVGILQKFPLRTMEQHLADVQVKLKYYYFIISLFTDHILASLFSSIMFL